MAKKQKAKEQKSNGISDFIKELWQATVSELSDTIRNNLEMLKEYM